MFELKILNYCLKLLCGVISVLDVLSSLFPFVFLVCLFPVRLSGSSAYRFMSIL